MSFKKWKSNSRFLPYSIGLLVQYGYFKVCGKFFTTKVFKAADIRAAAKILGVTPSEDFTNHYADRTRQKHRLLILESCGHLDFNSAIDIFEEAVTDMVDKQMHPRKLFYVIVEQLRQKKIESPSYDRIARTITDKFHAFEKTVVQTMADIITAEQQEALEQLISTEGESYERALLTRLKTINQSMKPGKIKQGMRNFLIIKKLHKGELANKFSAAVSFADQTILEPLKDDQEIAVMCKTIIQNIIILWNYLELTKIIMRSDIEERERLLESITSASILTWQHVNLHGTYDFSNLLSSNDAEYSLDEVINFKVA